MRENEFQANLIDRLHVMFPGCLVLKNDSGYIQGIPDLTVLYKTHWAMLEVKASERSKEQPNQCYYVDMADDNSFGAFIYPENEEEVLYALQRSFQTRRASRVS